VGVFGERIHHHPLVRLQFIRGGDDLLSNRVVGILRIDQRNEVGRNVHPEETLGGQGPALALRERDDLLQLLHRV
jgi:hypothetical protein